ncbi:MAG: ribonuclease PH [Deltaproteobacteria bacterium]|nr:ribonuclease PH [Deltaproteobacteria bacterium]
MRSMVRPTRAGGRAHEEGRPFLIEPGFTRHAEGSVLVSSGDTRVICTASLEDRVPPFLRGQNKGWVTAEYGMLPRATSTRTTREATNGKIGGRTAEIQRLIGRALRAVVNLEALGDHTVWIDCDVIQADGGTRTAAITGGFVALVLALRRLGQRYTFPAPPLTGHVAAVSVGLWEEWVLLDPDYAEDAGGAVDLNLVMTDTLEVVEIQGTAEGKPFSRAQLTAMLDLGEKGIRQRVEAQRNLLEGKLV